MSCPAFVRKLIALLSAAFFLTAAPAISRADKVHVLEIQSRVAAMAPSTGLRAISDGKAIFILRTAGDTAETFVDSARVKAEFGRKVMAMAFSQDGRRLAVAHKKNVSILTADSAQVLQEYKFPRDVYWVEWLANDSDLIAVCGKEAPRVAFAEGATGAMGDSFTLQLLRAETKKPKRLYSRQDYHPLQASPTLSEDRSQLYFFTREGMESGVKMVLSLTDLKVSRYEKPVE